MKLVQKLLSHGLLIGFFVASFFAYLYRADLFPQWFGDTPRSAALSGDSQSAPAKAVAEQLTGQTDRPAASSPPPARTTGVTAGDAVVTADLPPLMVPGGEAPAPEHRGMQDTTSDLPPLASAPVVDQASPQPPAAAPGTTDAESGPVAAVGFSAERSQDTGVPSPARFRPMDDASDTPARADTGASETAVLAEAGPVPDVPSPPRYRPIDDEPAAPAAPTAMDKPDMAAPAEAGQARFVPPPDTRTTDAVAQAPAPVAQQQAADVAAERSIEPPQTAQNSSTQQQGQSRSTGAATAGSGPTQDGSTAATADAGDFQQQLTVARTYFWRRDVRGALQAYQDLARVWPAQADAWGELGNLYLRIGDRPAAAEAYHRTMTILLDQGETGRAHALLEVLYGLDAVRASEMEKRFRRVSS